MRVRGRWSLGLGAAALTSLSCVHGRVATGATAELESLQLDLASSRMAQLAARYLIADAPGWAPGTARLVVTLDDTAFAAVVGEELQQGDALSVPILLDLTQAPEDLQQRVIDGVKIRVGVRGTLEVRIQGQPIRFPVNGELAVAAEKTASPRP